MMLLAKLSESDKSFRYKRGERVRGPIDSRAREDCSGVITEGCMNQEGRVVYEVQTDDGRFFAVDEDKLTRA